MAAHDTIGFEERLTAPWWAWLFTLALAMGLAAQLSMGRPGVTGWISFVLLVPAAAVVLLWLGWIRVRVDDALLRVDDAQLPLQFVSDVEVVEGLAWRDALSAQLHPDTFVVQRPWVRRGVRVWLNDPDDPTPCWIISSRRCHQLRDSLDAARRGAPAAPRRESTVLSSRAVTADQLALFLSGKLTAVVDQETT